MKTLSFIIIVSSILVSCHRHEVEPGCTELATVISLSATTGCGFGFKLADGTVLVAEPHNGKCGHADPLANFALADGLQVKIGYEFEHHHPSACTAGKSAEITCISAVSNTEKGI